VQDVRQASVFGRRREPHTVIIARGDQISSHFTIRPWLAALLGCAVAAMTIGYLLATSYLVLRDDLMGAAAARQARMQQAYEDRISMLRSQVDRITSRQLLDQQLMETKVAELLERQEQLTSRHGRISPILERASGGADGLPGAAPLPERRPDVRADAGRADPVFAVASFAAPVSAFWPKQAPIDVPTESSGTDLLFSEISHSLREIEVEQIERLEDLADNAFQEADRIAEALETAGLSIAIDAAPEAQGGPHVPIDADTAFETRVQELDTALLKLHAVKTAARSLPIHNPAPGHAISSTFGVRKDPLLGTPALHSGMDFRAPKGTPIRSSGAGTVITAGWSGGYGRMVEVEHEHGLTTRYAHMSRISVSEGDKVETGQVLGLVGSTGRSTGPHLHYEVRRDGKALDPLRFLKTGRKIGELM
jgi:murein DD-endopeptidase MepM/ murein hydrolase activator NlpD